MNKQMQGPKILFQYHEKWLKKELIYCYYIYKDLW